MSPCYIRQLTPEALLPVAYTAESLAQAAAFEPDDGVYTVTNTYQTFYVLKFDAHLDRMVSSAQRAGIPLELDRQRLRWALRTMIAAANFGDVRFRITAGRQQPDHLILSLEPFTPPAPALVQQGVTCVTLPDSARAMPEAKTTDWMHSRKSYSLPPGVYTGLLLDQQGRILEGLDSNFYAVRGGALWTAGTGALPGIAQQIVLAVAPGIIPVRREAVTVTELTALDEAFITSSSRGIIPVAAIDGVRIGAGVPGPVTGALRAAYQAWVQAHLEPL
jgi:branched-subunit amino acid aminotransferase/4-amino-4-deoxychorismate lyase